MTSIFDQINNAAKSAIEKAYGDAHDPILKWSAKPEFGDLQINAAMSLSKTVGENPREVASKILENLELDGLVAKNPEIAGPGFINIHLSDEILNSYISSITKDENLGVDVSNSDTIVIDYGGANIAKEMHIGHIRSTVIGDALNRILAFLGNKVIPQDHLGDWGTQFGMLIEFLAKDGEIPSELPELGDLDAFYKQAQTRFKEDEGFAKRARARVALLQGGDENSLRAWKYIYDVTMSHIIEVYTKLGVLINAENSRGESMYNDMLDDVCKELISKGIAVESEGALVVYKEGVLDRDGEPFGTIIRKSDGGYGYATTDLATLKYCAENDRADKVVYVIDARQSQHLEIVFDTCDRAGWIPNTVPFHAAFGTILGKDQKPFKTRSGDIVKLIDVIDEATSRAKALIEERKSDFNENEKHDLANAIGIGALKYGDLSNNRVKNYVFDWDRMLAMEGNTAPYLQYANARILSLISKSGFSVDEISAFEISVKEEQERSAVKQLSFFSEVLVDIAQTYEPHKLCTYLFDLAQSFSSFYETCPVLKEEDESIKKSRLNISLQISRVLCKGLNLLGIEAPNRL